MIRGYNFEFTKAITLVHNTVKVIKFYDAAGKSRKCHRIDMRVDGETAIASGWMGRVFWKPFNRKLNASYAVDEFVAASKYIYLENGETQYLGHFNIGDKLVVASATNPANDGTYTIAAITTSAGRIRFTVSETVAANETASPATAINTVDDTCFYSKTDETRLSVEFYAGEIHLLNVDGGGGGISVDVYCEFYSADDIQGTTVT